VVFHNSTRPASEVELVRFSRILKQTGPDHFQRVQRLGFHLVAFFLEGRCTHTVDFHPHPCRPGTLLHVQPGQVQRWDLTHTGLEAVVLLFTPAFLFPDRPRTGALWQERFFDEVTWPSAIHLDGEDREAMGDWFARLERVYREVDDTLVSAALLRHLVSALFLDLARRRHIGQGPMRAPDAELSRLRRFKADVERSFRITRRVLDYAQHLGCSAKTLDRTCRTALGVSAKSYVDARVVLEAKRILAHTALSIAAIGEDLGFSEPTNFVKFFKAREGCLPGVVRERSRPSSKAGRPARLTSFHG
jgi:AraC-like DNA-binding protein/quercetin dioxygenase-like cupin family protein